MDIKTISILDTLDMIDDLDNLKKEDLEKIDSLEITGRDFNNDPQTVDLNDLKYFPNLKNLSIEFYTIDYDSIMILKEIELDNLSFSSCEFIGVNDVFKELNTTNIYISNCYDFDISFLGSKEYNIVNISTEKINDMKINANKLNLEHCEIQKPEILKDLLIKELTISTNQYEQNPTIYDNLGYKVKIMDEDTNYLYKEIGVENV